ncbi:uncharacterized protein [Nicotiana sylvestris]|uniref:uncharacterized protein n=1 Tax=Nicotiana sylvestris TaxID=4096 RepID=UPI00388C6703
MSVKIKEEVTKQFDAKVILVTRYPTWLANVVLVPKKDDKTRVYVDYRDLNKILMDEEDVEKTAFIIPWVKWTDECQEAFDKINGYLSNPLVLVPPELGRPLILYLTILDSSFGCVLGQHDITSKKEQAIYYLSKKFTSYEVKYTQFERTCCALTWLAQKLKHYLSSYTTYLISCLDQLKYIFQKPMPTGRLAKWHILLTECDIVYVTQTTMKAQALADHLTENPVDEEYEPLKTYFSDEEVMHIDELEQFKITHCNSTSYRPKANGAVEAANKNIKKILRKMVEGSRQWHEKLPFALLGYRTIVRSSLGATPYLLVYGTKAVIPVEVEIPSLRIVVEAKIYDDEWIKTRLEQLSLIDEKRLAAVCHGQLYQQRMARAYNKKVRPRKFEVVQLVLKRILPH